MQWNDSFRFAFVSGDILRDNTTNRLRRARIKPGGTVECSLEFTTPRACQHLHRSLAADDRYRHVLWAELTSQIIVPGPTFYPHPNGIHHADQRPQHAHTPSATPAPPTETPTHRNANAMMKTRKPLCCQSGFL